jgi:Asp-tRNA(Asn)/Glu-tRNA(Gln) amidotransferase A subunit family amidase
MLDPLVAATATELAERLRRREITSVDVVEAHLDRIDEVDSTVNAIPVRRAREAILADAAQLDALSQPAGRCTACP